MGKMEIKNPDLWNTLISETGGLLRDLFPGQKKEVVVREVNAAPDYTIPLIAAGGIVAVALILKGRKRK